MILEILNILLIPTISLSVYSRRFNEPVNWSFNSISRYVSFVTANAVIMFAIITLLRLTIGVSVMLDSQIYTVLASIVAVILPYLFEIYMKFLDIRIDIDKKDEENRK